MTVLPNKWNIGLFIHLDAIMASIKGAIIISIALEHDKLLHSLSVEQCFLVTVIPPYSLSS